MSDLIETTPLGLYCRPGDFYIDPHRPVPRALVTHAHSDHARRGSESYLCAEPGQEILRTRMGPQPVIEHVPYGKTLRIKDTTVSFHPAGHVLGSAQIRVEHKGEVWVASGDYKREPDPTCAPFEVVRCHTFFSEATFGLPIYRWRSDAEVFEDIHAWWRENQTLGRTSIIFGYPLGKSQRLLANLKAEVGPILMHGTGAHLAELYARAGVRFPAYEIATEANAKAYKGRAIVIAPPSAQSSPWIRKFSPFSTAFASGWMQIRGTRRQKAVDRGFVISDHADWKDLIQTIDETGADRVGILYNSSDAIVRFLREKGKDAWEVRLPRVDAEITEED